MSTEAAGNLHSRDALVGRLLTTGVSRGVADELVGSHPRGRVADALDALEILDEEIRNPAGWVVTALRDGWDLTRLLADHREQQARLTQWEHEQALRDERDVRQRRRDMTVAGWSSAISCALDDDQLEAAVEQVTTPVGAVDRRSVPVVRAQLFAWAIAVHRSAPDVDLADALAADLQRGPSEGCSLAGELPQPPAQQVADDLHARLAEVFERRPDLEHPAQLEADGPQPPGRVLDLSLGRGPQL